MTDGYMSGLWAFRGAPPKRLGTSLADERGMGSVIGGAAEAEADDPIVPPRRVFVDADREGIGGCIGGGEGKM